ncbi:MAG TPA: FMN-binding protein [Ruminiclostridium sp.]|nr:FMN-binding protein [Ruminiclostridium sp.]
MAIPLYKDDVIYSGECINCFKCISACPRQNVAFGVAEGELRPVVAGAVAVTIMAGMYYAGPLVSSSNASSANKSISVSQNVENNVGDSNSGNDKSYSTDNSTANGNTSSAKKYKDGTYEGSGTGFRGGITTVSVTVKNSRITNVEVVSNQDTGRFFDRASGTVIDEILNTQSTQVDAVSGATYSSSGIMSAVEDALSRADLSSANIQSSNSKSIS